jgi:hypothetical protein
MQTELEHVEDKQFVNGTIINEIISGYGTKDATLEQT